MLQSAKALPSPSLPTSSAEPLRASPVLPLALPGGSEGVAANDFQAGIIALMRQQAQTQSEMSVLMEQMAADQAASVQRIEALLRADSGGHATAAVWAQEVDVDEESKPSPPTPVRASRTSAGALDVGAQRV